MDRIRLELEGLVVDVPRSAFRFQFFRCSGPGGQHVNKTSTGALLVFDHASCGVLSAAVRGRLLEVFGGEAIVVRATAHRSQGRNRAACVRKLSAAVSAALVERAERKVSRPGVVAVSRRLAAKRQRANKKALRGRPCTMID